MRLTALINRWASGPDSMEAPSRSVLPAIPPCQLPDLPELTLDDETDPPVSARNPIHVRIADADADADADGGFGREQDATAENRRMQARGRFESPLMAQCETGPIVLFGRDLSAGGMRIERIGDLRVGDRFRLALHGPMAPEPFVVQAEIVRDDGEAGFGLAFDAVDPAIATELEKLVACLPSVESLDEGEIGGLGAILLEILSD